MSKSHAFIKPVRGKSLKDKGIRPVIEFYLQKPYAALIFL
jgi:hypothetical protein